MSRYFLSGLLVFTQIGFADSRIETINDQISEYRSEFPEIEFLLLDSVFEFNAISPLLENLGSEVSNVDYEHPESVREILVEAQEYRIDKHLSNGNGSATLFRTPNASITKKPFTCLITLTSSLLDENPLASTRFLYSLSESSLSSLPQPYVLDNKKFQEYTIDHELFHCVDAYVNGPMFARTSDPIKASHDRYKEEQRAEIFAALRHLKRYPSDDFFLRSLATARTINLLTVDFEHYTTNILGRIIDSNDHAPSQKLSETAFYSMDYAESIVTDYEGHKAYLVTMAEVLDQLSIDHDLVSAYPAIEDETADPDRVRELLGVIRNAVISIRPEN